MAMHACRRRCREPTRPAASRISFFGISPKPKILITCKFNETQITVYLLQISFNLVNLFQKLEILLEFQLCVHVVAESLLGLRHHELITTG